MFKYFEFRLDINVATIVFAVFLVFVSGIHTLSAQDDDISDKQSEIQRILDMEGLSDDEMGAKLQDHGIIGEKIVSYVNYLTDRKKTPEFDNIFNYHVVEFLDGRDTDYNFRKIISLNKKYNILPESDYLLNLVLYKKQTLDGFKFHSDLQKGSHIKNLRYLVPHSDGKWDEYVSWVLPAKGYLYNREVSYWEDLLGQQICERSDRKKDCISKIGERVKRENASDVDEAFTKRIMCDVSLLHKGEFYNFNFCNRLSDLSD